MSYSTLFLLEVVLCLCLSAIVIALLRPYLIDVLTETCGTPKRAAFWVMFTQIMLVISPLLLVMLFTEATPQMHPYPVEAIKDALFRALGGIFAAITLVGRTIWKSIAAAPDANGRDSAAATVPQEV